MKSMTEHEIAQEELVEAFNANCCCGLDDFDALVDKMLLGHNYSQDDLENLSYDETIEIVGDLFGMELELNEETKQVVLVAYKAFA
jgi:hypothetical protein